MAHFALWFLGWYVFTTLGITAGYHRLLTHRAFSCWPILERLLITLGFLGMMGPPARWVAVHRYHHAHADRIEDPHSPVQGGWWWGQFLWMVPKERDKYLARVADPERLAQSPWAKMDSAEAAAFVRRWAPEVAADPYYRRLTGPAAIFLLCATLLAAACLGGWAGFLGRGIAALTVPWCTWLVNSSAHSASHGYRSFATRDGSRNVWWVALLTQGEGWHNNHHADPRSARHGVRWWEIDTTWLCIRIFKALGLAWDVRPFSFR